MHELIQEPLQPRYFLPYLFFFSIPTVAYYANKARTNSRLPRPNIATHPTQYIFREATNR